jgi:tetratricopeptide (TPR) repeat protein
MKTFLRLGLACAGMLTSATLAFGQQAPAGPAVPPLVAESQQRLRDGHLDEAVASAKQAIAAAPDSSAAHLQLGIVLDLQGQYQEARTHLQHAIEKATSPDETARATRALAVSYAFESNCTQAAATEGPLYDKALASKSFYDAGEVANELARICLESGDDKQAEAWYRKGFEAGKQDTTGQNGGPDLWNFRWEHAQARIAARRGQKDEAAAHIAAAKAILDAGKLPPAQAAFFPYLTGYVAFYGGDYAKAIADLQQANQNDVFIMSLLAQSYEKTGDTTQAQALYRKIMAATPHNPPAAFARPIARARLSALGPRD